jgi:hypothetical protein
LECTVCSSYARTVRIQYNVRASRRYSMMPHQTVEPQRRSSNVQSASAKVWTPSCVIDDDWARSRSAWPWPVAGLRLGPTPTHPPTGPGRQPPQRQRRRGGRTRQEEPHVRQRPRLGPYTPYSSHSQPRAGRRRRGHLARH